MNIIEIINYVGYGIIMPFLACIAIIYNEYDLAIVIILFAIWGKIQ